MTATAAQSAAATQSFAADLDALFPVPAELAIDARDNARALVRGVAEAGVRLRAKQLAFVRLVADNEHGALNWNSIREVTRLAKLHLSPAV